jgi:hypothetical protein
MNLLYYSIIIALIIIASATLLWILIEINRVEPPR